MAPDAADEVRPAISTGLVNIGEGLFDFFINGSGKLADLIDQGTHPRHIVGLGPFRPLLVRMGVIMIMFQPVFEQLDLFLLEC